MPLMIFFVGGVTSMSQVEVKASLKTVAIVI
jgi:hypothetical protein